MLLLMECRAFESNWTYDTVTTPARMCVPCPRVGCPYCTKRHLQWCKFENEHDYGVPLAVRHTSSFEANATSATPATSDDVVDPSYTKQCAHRPQELSDSQVLDSELQPVIHWMEGEAPTQNEVQFQGKITRILWNWGDLKCKMCS